MQLSKKATYRLKEISKSGEPISVYLVNHLNQKFVVTGIIPNYYEFVNGRFPNLSVVKDCVTIRFGESRSEKIELPTPELVLEKIEDVNGNLIFENYNYNYDAYLKTNWLNKEFHTMDKFSLENPANFLARKFVGKPVVYTGTKVENLHGKKCLITALGVDPVKNVVHVFFNRGYLFTDTKLVLPIQEFEESFELVTENNLSTEL